MRGDVVLAAEALVTDRAPVRLLTGVGPLVHHGVVAAGKPLVAIFALKGLAATVEALVHGGAILGASGHAWLIHVRVVVVILPGRSPRAAITITVIAGIAASVSFAAYRFKMFFMV